MERPHYFAGQLLTETELTSEQDYVLAKNRLHNRYLHGWGVVCGLEVVCHECEGWVTVQQGYAIDPCGDDIVVCKDQGFDFIKLVRDCDPATGSRRGDCDPVQYYQDKGCEDVEEHWCLAIVYEEKEARPMTTLRKDKAGDCACKCNGNGKQKNCGCGCHGAEKKSASSQSTSYAVGTTVGLCEPTRIAEGFHFCAIPAPEPASKQGGRGVLGMIKDLYGSSSLANPEPGTLLYELECCCESVSQLHALAPSKAKLDKMTARQAYQSCCEFRSAVSKFFAQATTSQCDLLEKLSAIRCVEPTEDNSDSVVPAIKVVKELDLLLMEYLIDCFCRALLPKCPPDPGDNRVILACLTIRGDKILDICNFEGRHQVVTFPDITYWLSALPQWTTVSHLLEQICCGDVEFIAGLLERNVQAEKKYASLGTAGGVYQAFGRLFKQMLGRCLRAYVPGAEEAGYVSPGIYVGQKWQSVERELKTAGVKFTRTSADWWSNEVLATSYLYAPETIAPDEHLILHTKGDLVVGVEVQNETQRLQLEVETLRKELNLVKREVSARGAAAAGAKKAPTSAPE